MRTKASPKCRIRFLFIICIFGVLAGSTLMLNISLNRRLHLKSVTEAQHETGERAIMIGPNHHTLISSGCSHSQDWQSYIFFYHAWKVGQPGNITRIASGCTPKQALELQQSFKEQISIMSDRFHLHLTPGYDEMSDGRAGYHYANKPNGLRHWMEHVLGSPYNSEHDDDIIILLDPDQMLLQPLTYDFANVNVIWHKTHAKDKSPALMMRVEHGKPFAALYGYGGQWRMNKNINITHIAGPKSPIHNISSNDVVDFYPAGPPYIATAKDMYKVVVKWTEFLPRVYDTNTNLLVEMFAYSLAAAHLRLPHQLAKSFMFSQATIQREGWELIDAVPESDVCYNVPKDKLPFTIHYCQRYMRGKWFVSKRSLPENFLSSNVSAACQAPLLSEPPHDTAIRYNYSIYEGEIKEDDAKRPEFNRREAFMVCSIIRGFNEAAEFFKTKNCPSGTANLDKTDFFPIY